MYCRKVHRRTKRNKNNKKERNFRDNLKVTGDKISQPNVYKRGNIEKEGKEVDDNEKI